MALPGNPASLFDQDWLVRKLQDYDRQLNELRAANQLGPAGLRAKTGGVEFDGYVTTGGALTVNGPAVITGTLSLPAGIIGNDALAAPITTGSSGTSETNFLIDTTHRKRSTGYITIPAGFTTATVMAIANGFGVNNSAGADYLSVQAYITTGAGGNAPQYAGPSGGTASATGTAIKTLTALTGGTIEVGAYVYAAAGSWGTTAQNIVNVDVIATFTR